jgi:hypothetical protein
MVPDKTGRVKTAFFAARQSEVASNFNKFNELTIGTTIA